MSDVLFKYNKKGGTKMYKSNFVLTYKDREDQTTTIKIKDLDELYEILDDLIAECADISIAGTARWKEEEV